MIEIENVEKSFGSLKVLDGVSLTVNKGEVVSIIGGSGSGKSTLLMCINGLEPIQGGRIKVDGTEVHARGTDLNKLRQRIGIVCAMSRMRAESSLKRASSASSPRIDSCARMSAAACPRPCSSSQSA